MRKIYDKLIKRVRKYHPSDDISMIEKAFDIAYHAHEGQCRKSGEPYIIHPLWVGIILADLELDKETIVFASNDIARYIKDNLTKIGNCGIHTEVKKVEEIIVPEKRTEPISGTVQSVRIDSVLSVALKTSRSKTVQFIQSEKVQVNWKIISDTSYQMKEGDVFSVRGYGRFNLFSVNGTTKKGRISITIQKYL